MINKSKDIEINEKKKQDLVDLKTVQEKIIPKFCTNINIGLLNNKNVILTMVYDEGKNNLALIDRIVIDLEHAKSLNEVLAKLLKEAKNVHN